MAEVETVTTYAAIVGAVLAQLRSSAGLKQSDLAEAVGVGPSTWSRIEKGESSLSTDQLKLAADALKMPPSKILELVALAEEAVAATGIKREPVGEARWTSAAVAIGLGLLPVVGSTLIGLLGNAMKDVIVKAIKK